MTVITNGTLVLPDSILEDHDLIIRDGRIDAIIPRSRAVLGQAANVIDARGGHVLPGFIDIHSDYIEHMAAPRPSSVMDFALSLHETERELIGHGVTTMFHSLSIYKQTLFTEKPIRNPENIKKFIDLIADSHTSRHLVRHRFHARYEIDNLDRVDELVGYICEGKIHLVSFMDHTPGQGQYRDLEIFKQTLKGYQSWSDDDLDRVINETQSTPKLTLERIASVAAIACEHGVAVASHDDDSPEKVALVKSFGTTISEFPITMEVAHTARAIGLKTIVGAPNVLLGGSHSGNLCAASAIKAGAVDILCSDYYPAALLHAVYRMHEQHGMDLARMVKLVTLHPAQAVYLDSELGSLEKGKRADILVVEKLDDGLPVVTSAIVDGVSVFHTEYRSRGTMAQAAVPVQGASA